MLFTHLFKHVNVSEVIEDIKAVDASHQDYGFAKASDEYSTIIDVIPFLEYLAEYQIDSSEMVRISDEEEIPFQDWLYDYSGLEEMKADNSYNWSSPISHDINFEIYGLDEYEEIFVVCRVHRFGDVRSNYTDEFILKFDSYYDDFTYMFYAPDYSDSASKYISVKVDEYNVHVSLDWYRDVCDILIENEDGETIEELYDFSLSAWSKEELIEELREIIKENI